MQTFNCEYTDTFGGEANYAWVRRQSIAVADSASDRAVVHAAKRALGLTGVRCRRDSYGDDIVLRPCNSCTIVFISHKGN